MTRPPVAPLLLALVTASTAWAQDPPEGHKVAPDSAHEPAWTFESGRTLWLFPANDVQPTFIADPYRPVNAAMFQLYSRTGIYDSTSVRTGLSAGGRFGIFRLDPAEPGGRSWQISVDAGLMAQFDSNHKHDSVGWDGHYGFGVSTARGAWSFRLAMLHTSAHIGDEYAERTGRERIDYTREELVWTTAYSVSRGLRVYGEMGYGYYLLTEEQRPWQVQAGVEYTSRHTLMGGRLAWYAATDLSATEERDWRLDLAIQGGLTATSNGRRWRLGVQYIDGRPPLGEFFMDTEAWFTFGVWMDL